LALTRRWKLLVLACVALGAALAGAYAMAERHTHSSAKTRYLHPRFKISGTLRVARLRPGVKRPLDLRLSNPHRFTIWVTSVRMSVSLDRAHRKAGCSVRRDFYTRPLPRSELPIKVRPRRKRRLRRLGVERLPAIGMRNLRTVNQDACKGARVRLKYRGNSLRWRPAPIAWSAHRP
jgi:hypothetical protein